ncbi:MAG TPA: hypothetical protein VMV59_12115 [Candidatus Dormibacteraeota bacterium]|nr:hypothetical protein [Candidatus Dormibacteraeota bacterium]
MPTANGTPKTPEANDKTAAGEARDETQPLATIARDKSHAVQARRESEGGSDGL